MMRNCEIARALGLSKASISMLIKRGMPTTNLDDVNLWREAHLQLRPKREPATPPTPAPPTRRAVASSLSALERLGQQEQQLSDDIEVETISLHEATKDHQPTDRIQSRLALLRKEHAAAVKSLLASQKQSLEIAVRRGELITAEASETYTAAVLLPAIAAIRGMARYGHDEVEKQRLSKIANIILDTMRESSATATAMPAGTLTLSNSKRDTAGSLVRRNRGSI
jgi:hypothetical protein